MRPIRKIENGRRPDWDSINQLFERQVARTPDAIAVRAGDQVVTYETLDRRANQLACMLRARGIGPGSRIGILVPHSIETVAALLGVLKSGAAYLPLDAESPASRLRASLENAQVKVVIATSDMAPLLGNGRTILDPEEASLTNADSLGPVVRISPDDPAYVIYSSGSTGTPKGIVIQHRALINYVTWANSVYLDGGSDTALYSSLAFDLTVTSIFVPLTTGGTIVAYRRRGAEPPILDVLREDRVDFIKLTPSHLRIIAEQPTIPLRLRTLIVGGENLDTALARRTHDRFESRVSIFNEYGPTEATVGCMIHRFDPHKDNRYSVPLGEPASGTAIYLVDEKMRPVRGAGIGEIYIGGLGLAAGYLNAPVLTAERFISNPFQPGQLVYRSGDLAQRLPDGTLEFIGRIDDQIKVRGHRIHLNEIRDVILTYPNVTECVVRLLEDADGSQVLVAYYTSPSAIDPKALRLFALSRLMAATVPNVFVHLQHLPLTVNGKVQLEALPGLESIKQRATSVAEGPRTNTERRMAEIWCALLRASDIGIRDGFFELGGDSLAAVRLLSNIEAVFGVHLSPDAVLTDPTIEGLARKIDGWQAPVRHSLLVPLQPRGPRAPLFLLPGIAGEIMCHVPLIRHLSPEQPVYGVADEGVKYTGASDLEIESLARTYLEAIREVQPEGPYNLAGYSAGGICAFEVARQIRAAGESVRLLAIIDANAPPALRPKLRWSPRTLGQFFVNLAYLLVDDLMASDVADLRNRFQSKLRLLRNAVRRSGRNQGNRHDGLDIRDVAGVPGLLEQHIHRVEAFVAAIDKYRPGRYDGSVTLLRARTFGLLQPIAHDRGWSALVNDLKIRVIKGNHESILREPIVRQVANEFERLLNPNGTGCSV